MTKPLRPTIVRLIGAFVLTATPAWAAPITLGTFSGTTVDFVNVVSSDDALINAAIISGDTLTFSLIRFQTDASGAGGSDSTAATVTFELIPKTGFALQSFGAAESGTFEIAGPGSGATRFVSHLDADVAIDEVDGSAVAPVNGGIDITTIYTNPGNSPWSFSGTNFYAGVLNFNGVPFVQGATHSSISVTNTVSTQSEAGTSAHGEKTAFSVTGEALPQSFVPVPEPAATTLVLAGLAAAAARGRKRRT